MEKNLPVLSPLVLGVFQEKETSTHPAMWNALLAFMKSTFFSLSLSLDVQYCIASSNLMSYRVSRGVEACQRPQARHAPSEGLSAV